MRVSEVAQALFVDPGIVRAERRDARAHDVAREELRQRGRDRSQQVVRPDEFDVGVAGAAHAGQHEAQARDFLALEADGRGQREPELEAALARAQAVVIVDPPHPLAAEARVAGFREDQAVLHGDARLVVVAVAHPDLDLRAREAALVHAQVEGMPVVVVLRADAAQRGLEGLRGETHSSSS